MYRTQLCCYTQCMPLKNDPNELTNVVRWNSHHHHIKVNQLDMLLYFAFLDLVARTDHYFRIFYQYCINLYFSSILQRTGIVHFAVNHGFTCFCFTVFFSSRKIHARWGPPVDIILKHAHTWSTMSACFFCLKTHYPNIFW